MTNVTDFKLSSTEIKKHTLSQAAKTKFGDVIECHNGILLIKRSDGVAPVPDKPYMTIQGDVHEGKAAFYHGHYDMSFKDAAADFLKRSGQTD